MASKFTSEKPQGVQAEDDPVAPVGGVNPASRPAGLTLRTPTALGASSRSSPKAPEPEIRGTGKIRDPERSTLAWTPAPLLCRRLNVPVPKISSLIDWATKSGPHAGRGAVAAPQQDLLGSRGNFVSEVSAPIHPKVRCYMYIYVRSTRYRVFLSRTQVPCIQDSSAFGFQQQSKYEFLPDKRSIHDYVWELFELKPMHTTAEDALGAFTVYDTYLLIFFHSEILLETFFLFVCLAGVPGPLATRYGAKTPSQHRV